jgi:hypothetical protein
LFILDSNLHRVQLPSAHARSKDELFGFKFLHCTFYMAEKPKAKSQKPKAKSLIVLDPVSKAIAEHGGGNFRQKTFVCGLKNGRAVIKMHDKPRSVWHSPTREKFGNQRLHNLINEVLAVEIALRDH